MQSRDQTEMLFSTFHVISQGITHFYHALAYTHTEIQNTELFACQHLHSVILGRDVSPLCPSSLPIVSYNQGCFNYSITTNKSFSFNTYSDIYMQSKKNCRERKMRKGINKERISIMIYHKMTFCHCTSAGAVTSHKTSL